MHIQVYLHHALVNQGVLSGLTDDQISPLHNDNCYKERCVASVLKGLSLEVGLQIAKIWAQLWVGSKAQDVAEVILCFKS